MDESCSTSSATFGCKSNTEFFNTPSETSVCFQGPLMADTVNVNLSTMGIAPCSVRWAEYPGCSFRETSLQGHMFTAQQTQKSNLYLWDLELPQTLSCKMQIFLALTNEPS